MKSRVLIVDDDLALAEMLGIVMRSEGLDVVHVADGASALAAFREAVVPEDDWEDYLIEETP